MRRGRAQIERGIDGTAAPTKPGACARFGEFGRSTPQLHAKVAVVDRRSPLVGSANLDGGSAVANTELGVVIDSPALAGAFAAWLDGDRFTSVYQLRLQADGQTIAWAHLEENGRTSATITEPGSGWWLRWKLRLLSLLVEERDL